MVNLAFGSQQCAQKLTTVFFLCLPCPYVVRITIGDICKGYSIFLVSGYALGLSKPKRIYKLLRATKYIHKNNSSYWQRGKTWYFNRY